MERKEIKERGLKPRITLQSVNMDELTIIDLDFDNYQLGEPEKKKETIACVFKRPDKSKSNDSGTALF